MNELAHRPSGESCTQAQQNECLVLTQRKLTRGSKTTEEVRCSVHPAAGAEGAAWDPGAPGRSQPTPFVGASLEFSWSTSDLKLPAPAVQPVGIHSVHAHLPASSGAGLEAFSQRWHTHQTCPVEVTSVLSRQGSVVQEKWADRDSTQQDGASSRKTATEAQALASVCLLLQLGLGGSASMPSSVPPQQQAQLSISQTAVHASYLAGYSTTRGHEGRSKRDAGIHSIFSAILPCP